MTELAADGFTIALVLLAALLHASWNALVKSGGDPFVNIAVVTATGGIAAIPFLFVYPLPSGETWKWLCCSAVIHFIYQLGLVRMYRLGELSQVYPIARGLAPLGVATLGAFFAGEWLAWPQGLGLMICATAIVVLGRSGGTGLDGTSRGGAVRTALVVAALVSLYTLTDGRGVRSVAEPEYFIAWSFFLCAAPFSVYVIAKRGSAGLSALRRDGPRAVVGGLMATLGYGIALWAMSHAPLAAVSSLRESSVLFAALIGAFVLGESFGRVRILSAIALLFGLVLVQLGG